MSGSSEIEALAAIHDALQGLESPDARQRIIAWIVDKFGAEGASDAVRDRSGAGQERKRSNRRGKAKTKRKGKKSPGTVGRPSLNKALNLKPKGKLAFVAFVEAKKPKNNYDKCVLAVYYLRKTLEETATVDSVFTCFKEVGWRVPTDLRNTLQATASRKGWLDTNDADDIKLTTRGENHIEHDLPAATT